MRWLLVVVALIGCTHVRAAKLGTIARGESCRITMREGDVETIYERDDRGRVVRSPYFARGFDRDGRWITEERSGTVGWRRYDRAGRVARIDYRDRDGKTWSTRIVRDGDGRIVEKYDERRAGLPAWRERWTYDARGNLLHYRHTEKSRVLNEWAWTYDARDRVATSVGLATVSTGTTWSRTAWRYGDREVIARETTDGLAGVRTTTYRFDDAGRLVERAYATDDGAGSTTTYDHDPVSGALVGVHFPGGETRYERDGAITRAGTKTMDDECPAGGEPIRELDAYFAPDRERLSDMPWFPDET